MSQDNPLLSMEQQFEMLKNELILQKTQINTLTANNEQLQNRAIQQVQNEINQETLRQSQPVNSVSAPRISFPEKFDGTRAKFRDFINQMEFIFRSFPSFFPDSTSKIFSFGTNLTGNALKWFNPYLEHPNSSPHSVHLALWDAFRAALEPVF